MNEKIRARNYKYEIGSEINESTSIDFIFVLIQGLVFRIFWFCLYRPIDIISKHLHILKVENVVMRAVGINVTCMLSIYLNSLIYKRCITLILIQIFICSLHKKLTYNFVYDKRSMCLLIEGTRPMNAVEKWFSRNVIYPIDAVMCIPLLKIAVILLPLYSSFLFNLRIDVYTFLFTCILLKNSINATSGPVQQLVHIIGHTKPFSCCKSIVFSTINMVYSCLVFPWHVGFEPYFYELHHVHCHHVEHCSPDDWQTPLCYDRLSLSNYIVFNFHLSLKILTGVSFIRYFYRKRLYILIFKVLCGISFRLLFMTMLYECSKLMFYGHLFLIIPDGIGYEIAWAEHGLIDVNDLTNVFSSSASYLEDQRREDPMNNWLHCEHHQRGSLHWSLLRDLHGKNTESGLYNTFKGNLFFWNGNTRHGIHRLFITHNLEQLNSPISVFRDILYSRTRPYSVIKKNEKVILHPKRGSKIVNRIDKFLLPLWKCIGEM